MKFKSVAIVIGILLIFLFPKGVFAAHFELINKGSDGTEIYVDTDSFEIRYDNKKRTYLQAWVKYEWGSEMLSGQRKNGQKISPKGNWNDYKYDKYLVIQSIQSPVISGDLEVLLCDYSDNALIAISNFKNQNFKLKAERPGSTAEFIINLILNKFMEQHKDEVDTYFKKATKIDI